MFVIARNLSQALSKRDSYIARPNFALDKRTILCLYVPEFQRQEFKHVLKCTWIPLTKFQWTPRTNTCSVNFVGTLILLRILQRANIGCCSGFRECRRIPQMRKDSRNLCEFPFQLADSPSRLRIPFTICGFHLVADSSSLNLLNTYYYLLMDYLNWFRILQILLRIPQSCLFLERF